MPAAFPGPYTDTTLTQRGPFDAVAAPASVMNPRDLGENRSYREGLADSPREVDLSAQQEDPKQQLHGPNWRVGFDPYSVGGGLESFLDNAT